ncbi:MAG: YARHG domain-containing protein [Lachnospiraceae bacterium]
MKKKAVICFTVATLTIGVAACERQGLSNEGKQISSQEEKTEEVGEEADEEKKQEETQKETEEKKETKKKEEAKKKEEEKKKEEAKEEAKKQAEAEYIFPHSDTQRLTEEELKGLDQDKLRIAKNEIYARHGRKFSDSALQAYFSEKSWYNGTIEPDAFSEDLLNEIEKDNIQLIASLADGTTASKTENADIPQPNEAERAEAYASMTQDALNNGIGSVDGVLIPIYSGDISRMGQFTPWEGDPPDNESNHVDMAMHIGTTSASANSSVINGDLLSGTSFQVNNDNKLSVWLAAANVYFPLREGYALSTDGLTNEEAIGAILSRFDRPAGYNSGGPYNEYGIALDGTYNGEYDFHYYDTANGISKSDHDAWAEWFSY